MHSTWMDSFVLVQNLKRVPFVKIILKRVQLSQRRCKGNLKRPTQSKLPSIPRFFLSQHTQYLGASVSHSAFLSLKFSSISHNLSHGFSSFTRAFPFCSLTTYFLLQIFLGAVSLVLKALLGQNPFKFEKSRAVYLY